MWKDEDKVVSNPSEEWINNGLDLIRLMMKEKVANLEEVWGR